MSDDQPHRLVDGELPLALEARAKRLAFDVRHHVVQQAVRLAGVEQRQQVRVLQVRRDLDLAQESLGAEHRGELRLEHLDRDVAVVLEVVREVDRRHAARAELALDAVAVGEGGREAEEGLAHCFTFARSSVSQFSTYTTPRLAVPDCSRIMRKRWPSGDTSYCCRLRARR